MYKHWFDRIFLNDQKLFADFLATSLMIPFLFLLFPSIAVLPTNLLAAFVIMFLGAWLSLGGCVLTGLSIATIPRVEVAVSFLLSLLGWVSCLAAASQIVGYADVQLLRWMLVTAACVKILCAAAILMRFWGVWQAYFIAAGLSLGLLVANFAMAKTSGLVDLLPWLYWSKGIGSISLLVPVLFVLRQYLNQRVIKTESKDKIYQDLMMKGLAVSALAELIVLLLPLGSEFSLSQCAMDASFIFANIVSYCYYMRLRRARAWIESDLSNAFESDESQALDLSSEKLVSFRAPVFTIQLDLGAKVPTILERNWYHEVFRSAFDDDFNRLLLGTLHGTAAQYLGCANSFVSSTPCFDLLKQLVRVQIETPAIARKRTDGMHRLLQIADPQLREILDATAMAHTQDAKIFCFLDYNWVDRFNIANQPRNEVQWTFAYDFIQANSALSQLFDYRDGLWISENAVQVLIKEKPEMHKLWADSLLLQTSAQQKYYWIKTAQLQLQPELYDPVQREPLLRHQQIRDETKNQLKLLDVRLDSVRTAEQAFSVFDEIQEYVWEGFAEKDEVIERIIRAFEQGRQGLGSYSLDELRTRAYRSAQKIGFPGQMMLEAHHEQRSNRQLETLFKQASEAGSESYFSAWLRLLSLDEVPIEGGSSQNALLNLVRVTSKRAARKYSRDKILLEQLKRKFGI